MFLSFHAHALELDWSGQLRTEGHFLFNYSQDTNLTPDVSRLNSGGYYIPGSGDPNANFQTLFMRLKPSLIVNDNVYLYSEFWISDPIYGFFGSASPWTVDQRQFNSTFSRGSAITAQRFWTEIVTDLGTLKVGRVPLNWGLGLVWNSGAGLWDRYMSTGDAFGIRSKVGSFTLTPQLIKYSMGNSVSGACTINPATGTCTTAIGTSNIGDLSIALEYENLDDEAKVGANFIRRFTDSAQDPNVGFFGVNGTTSQASAAIYNIFDLYAKKKMGKFTVAGEVPITTGDVSGAAYNTFAIAAELGYQPNSAWEFNLKGGRAPGTGNVSGATFPTSGVNYNAFYFHQNYKIAMIMFNYAFQNFRGPNAANNPALSAASLKSPFDSQIVNANYGALTARHHSDRWNFYSTLAVATAVSVAGTSGFNFNYWDHRYYAYGGGSQGNFMGWEMDYGAALKWDDHFEMGLDLGFYFPGNFFAFSNTATDNRQGMVFGSLLRAGMTF